MKPKMHFAIALVLAVCASILPGSAGGALMGRFADLVLEGGPWLDVRAHGAKGDRTTNDTAYVVAAIAAAENGATIFFPKTAAGYLLGTLGTIRKQITLDFGGSTIYLTGTAPLMTLGSVGESGRAVIVRNAYFTPAAGVTNLSTVIKIDGAINTLIENCRFHGITSTHSLVWNKAGYGLTVRKCEFRWNNAPAMIHMSQKQDESSYSYNFNITNIDISHATGTGIRLEGGDGSINHSVIETCSNGGIVKDNTWYMFGLDISDNYFESNSRYDIHFNETTTFTTAAINGNKFIGTAATDNTKIYLGIATRVTAKGNLYQYGGVNGNKATLAGTYYGVQNMVSQRAAGYTGLRELHDDIRSAANFTYHIVSPYYPTADTGVADFHKLRVGHGAGQITRTMYGTKTWKPGTVAENAAVTTSLAVTGAAPFDIVAVGFTAFSGASPLEGFITSGQVLSADNVSVTLLNRSGASRTLDTGTLKVLVIKATP